ncbi:MAG: hypothetical protein ACOH1Q_12290 [Thiobacillus sp.]
MKYPHSHLLLGSLGTTEGQFSSAASLEFIFPQFRIDKRLAGTEVDWSDVSYIGMTNSQQGLRGRWQQFSNSVHGKNGHSGGNTVFRALGLYDDWTQQLFVAALPVEQCDQSNRTGLD